MMSGHTSGAPSLYFDAEEYNDHDNVHSRSRDNVHIRSRDNEDAESDYEDAIELAGSSLCLSSRGDELDRLQQQQQQQHPVDFHLERW